jgi:hypothetical protein
MSDGDNVEAGGVDKTKASRRVDNVSTVDVTALDGCTVTGTCDGEEEDDETDDDDDE